MTLGEAQAIAPELHSTEHEASADRAALEQLAHWALRFSPTIQPVEPDTLLLDVTGCERLFAGEHNIVRQARDGLRVLGFTARAAIADTAGAAYALALAHTDDAVVCPAGQVSAYLVPLPPIALRIDSTADRQLHALGVRTIGDLLMLPRATLPARFGQSFVRRLEQTLGEVIEPLDALCIERPPEARITFDGPLCDLPTLQIVAGRLLSELFEHLVRRELAIRVLDCILIHEQRPPTLLAIGMARASRALQHISELIAQRLENIDTGEGVAGMLLIARQTSRWHGTQGDLFEPRDPGDEEAFDSLLDRLINRLGHAAVTRAEPVDDYQPESAYRLAGRWEGGSANHSHLPTFSPSHAPPRPTRLLERPLPVRVMALVPDGPPTWISVRGRDYIVARAWGPERIETAWWRGSDVQRDYFRILAESGELFWLYRDRGNAQWNLHGVFA